MPEIKIAFVVGHHSRNKGRWSKILNIYEYDFFWAVSTLLEGVDVFTYDATGYTADIKKLARKLNRERYDLVVEGHFGWSQNGKANGCETLYRFDCVQSKQFAGLFSDVLCSEAKIAKRGNNGMRAVVTSEDRGFSVVKEYKRPMIMIEPFFSSNKEDCKNVGDINKLAGIIQKFINEARVSIQRKLPNL